MNKKYSKCDPIKDYFPLPNEIFYLNLSYGEIAVYSYLLYRENRKNYQCHPSYKTIGEALKMSKNTVCKYVRQLEEKELIATEPTNVFTKDGKNSTEIFSTRYCLLSKRNNIFITANSKMSIVLPQKINNENVLQGSISIAINKQFDGSGGENGKYYLKAGQSEGSASRPLTDHIGRQSRPFKAF